MPYALSTFFEHHDTPTTTENGAIPHAADPAADTAPGRLVHATHNRSAVYVGWSNLPAILH
jgi:hypothetical protein